MYLLYNCSCINECIADDNGHDENSIFRLILRNRCCLHGTSRTHRDSCRDVGIPTIVLVVLVTLDQRGQYYV